MILTAQSQSPLTFKSPQFSLSITQRLKTTLIDMNLLFPFVNTRHLPTTHRILKKNLPTILRSQCFNDNNLPFSQEVKATEIGHLFEHMVLEYMCIFKIANGSLEAAFTGETHWNWILEQRGVFHIRIDAGIAERNIFEQALAESIALLQTILSDQTGISVPTRQQRIPSPPQLQVEIPLNTFQSA